jgi:leucyl aminopeptidase (aminopeptidase T)
MGLLASAEAALDCLGVQGSDAVVVVFNDEQRRIAEALADAATRRARAVTRLEFVPTSRHGEEPPADVAEAMLAADVVLAPTSKALTLTMARQAATRRGVRVATLPTITEEIFVRALPIDYSELRRISHAVAARLSAASHARVTSPAGTDIVVTLEGREGRSDDGNLQQPGAFGNLPAGEGYIAPIETAGDGTIVIDGSLAGYGHLADPVSITVRDGRAVEASGSVGQWLMTTLQAGGEHGCSLAELGVGTNRSARLSGNVLEDEKASGTAHFAFGASQGLGGANAATVHIDGVMLDVRIDLDGNALLNDGHLTLI